MIGTTVGNYRIVERLGDGGMGSVYRAVDEMLDREVAIKVLRPELARQAALVERFRQEARALAQLHHPRIAILHGLERHGDELLMIMEYVRGDTLEAIVERSGRIAWTRAAELCVAVLDALEHAHDKQIVHRDIKPANVMLSHGGAVKVMDFGIARMLGKSRQTQFGHAVGTPTYMAPEQLRGEEVDRRTDLYAVGAVLHELVTGRLPFEADSDYRLMMMQLNDPPPRPSTLLADVPVAMDEVIACAMAKSRDDRYPDARAFARALEELVAGHGARVPHAPRAAAPATRVAAPQPVWPAPAETAAHSLRSDAPDAPGATRVAGGAPETRLAGTGAPPATLTRRLDASVRVALESLPGWGRDWRTWSAAGALLVAAGASAIALRGPGAPADDDTGVTTAATIAEATPPASPVDGRVEVTPVRGAEVPGSVREDASSLIMGAPPVSPTAPAPEPPPRREERRGEGSPPAKEKEPPRRDEPPRREERGAAPDPVAPEPEPARPRPEPVREAGQTEAEARVAVSAALSDAAGRLSGRDPAVAEALLRGGVAGDWASLMREGRVSMSLSGAPSVQLDGDRASAEFDASVNVRSPFGANRTRSARFSAQLERSGDRWVVRSLQPTGALELR